MKIATLLLIVFLAWRPAVAEDAVAPESAGFSAERLLRIDDAIVRDIEDDKLSGAVALVARDGDIVYHKAFGYADIAGRESMTTDSIFRIASMTRMLATDSDGGVSVVLPSSTAAAKARSWWV